MNEQFSERGGAERQRERSAGFTGSKLVIPILLLTGCFGDVATVSVLLPLAPEGVTSTSVFVIDRARGVVVASATVSPSTNEIELGVPAERTLLFTVLARTADVGPPSLGGQMPGFIGRAERQIPLGREQEILQITAHPAGALSLLPIIGDGVDSAIDVSLEGEAGDPAIPIRIDPERPLPRVFAARVGRYRVVPTEGSRDSATIVGGEGFFVDRRTESIGVFALARPAPIMPPEAATTIELELRADRDPIDPPVRTGTAASSLEVSVVAEDSTGLDVDDARAEVEVEVETVPDGLVAGRRLSAVGLPARLPPFDVRGSGRMIIRAAARLGGRTLRTELRTNVLGPADVPGPADRLDLALVDLDVPIGGTQLGVELIDRRGFYSSDTGAVDFGRSDPFIYFPDGPEAVVGPEAQGHVLWRIARPSSPRGLFVVLRATFTSTSVPGTLTASVALPAVESM